MLTPQHALVVKGGGQTLCIGGSVGQRLGRGADGGEVKGFGFWCANQEQKHDQGDAERQHAEGKPTH